jgi:hypothetical protein
MVGAATSRRAGLGSAATALVFALTAGTGCGSLPARHTPPQGHPPAQATSAAPKPAAVTLPRVQGGLPWPVALRTADGTYAIARNGAMRWLRPAVQHARALGGHPAGFAWVNQPAGIWATMRRGHLVIVRNRAVIWQSADRYAIRDASHMNIILTGRPGIAFEVHGSGPWFMARWHGPEHLVAAAGWPDMWTRSGNLIAVLHARRSRNFSYAVFSPSGTRLATLATGLSVSEFDRSYSDPATGTFWFLAGGDLVRTDGTATSVIASTRALGFTSVPQVGIFGGGLIQLLSPTWRQGQIILYPGGQLFARIPAPRGQVGGFGWLSVSPGHRMVAYTITTDSWGNGSTVFLVRPGDAPVAVYRAVPGNSPCAPPPLAWHGSWLLYTPPRGHAVLIDAAGSHRVIRLPSTLPGSNGRTVRVQAVSWR